MYVLQMQYCALQCNTLMHIVAAALDKLSLSSMQWMYEWSDESPPIWGLGLVSGCVIFCGRHRA